MARTSAVAALTPQEAAIQLEQLDHNFYLFTSISASVVGSSPRDDSSQLVTSIDGQRDPVCGMRVHRGSACELANAGRSHFFCSCSCDDEFA